MARKRKQPQKIGQIKLTDRQREVIAAGVDSEFFKLIRDVIIPQRVTQIALTSLGASMDEHDLFFYKGMSHLATWFPEFLAGEAEKLDDAVYENDEDGDGRNDARDDHSV